MLQIEVPLETSLQIAEIAQKMNVKVIFDPAPAIARRTRALLQMHHLENTDPAYADIDFATTGNLDAFKHAIRRLSGIQKEPIQLVWNKNNEKIMSRG